MNRKLFQSNPGNVPDANTTNEAGGAAYSLPDEAALRQYVMTGTFNGTFYVNDGADQLTRVLELANKCSVEFVAELAVAARQRGHMKDTPAVLTAFVSTKDTNLFKQIFPQTINDPKMLRNFVQVMRSNAVGRKSLGTAPKRMIQNYLNGLTDEQLFRADVGANPSLADIIKMVHPKAASPSRNALYAYIIGKDYNAEELLPLARQYEAFKNDMTLDIPNVPFQLLTALPLTDEHWKKIAMNATWNQLRMNLNTFERHGVLKDKNVVSHIANKLSNADEVRHSRTFPYQLFTTFSNMSADVPMEIKLAIQSAGEIAIENVPTIEGQVYILLDVSGSMRDPITGRRINPRTGKEESFTSKMSCGQVAALFAASILRKNKMASIIPFDTAVRKIDINPLDTVFTNATKLAINGGGTDCGVALAYLNEKQAKGDVVVLISDNQSFVQSTQTRKNETPLMREWNKFRDRNRNAKLINLDIAPYESVQAVDPRSILNVGGFSDEVFNVVSSFVKGE